MNIVAIILLLFLKFFLPFLIFIYPFQASWLNFILDTSDGDVLMHFGLPYVFYQTWDKAADYVTYIMMFVVGRKWAIGKLITVLFVLRTVGQFIFFVTRNDMIFFFLPNLLEPLFMIYSLLLFMKKDKAFIVYQKYLLPIWCLIIVYKMWNEWNIHIARLDLSNAVFGFNN